jgi:glycosyltransferase involved in cell wall biosynthesis
MDHNKKVILISDYLYNDPPTRNAIYSFKDAGFKLTYIEHSEKKNKNVLPQGVSEIRIPFFYFFSGGVLNKIFNIVWLSYRLNRIISKENPAIVVAIMFRPIALIKKKKGIFYIASVLDIPSMAFSGRLDRIIYQRVWKKIKNWDLIWASDEYKAEKVQQLGQLSAQPVICYNCPRLDYFEGYQKFDSRNWVLELLNTKYGIKFCSRGEPILLLRAGAIGEFGAIEETILALKELPANLIFILIGRPDKEYKLHLEKLIIQEKLTDRVCLYDRPDDDEWKKFLLGADIGHLIHIRPDEKDNPAIAANYDLNSSLSNNRMFQYMAAGLPILSYNDSRMKEIHNTVDCFSVVNISNLKNELLAKINELIKDKNLRNYKGNNANSAYMNIFNWDFQFNKGLKII